jgi:hypothetical protein
MSRFCTRCGAANDADARFCDACGHRFAPRRMAPAARAPRATARPFDLRYLVGGGLALLLLGGGAWYLLAPQTASEAVFAAAIDRYALAQPDAFQDKVCLDNFPYARDPALTSVFDAGSNDWLAELVKAGVYAAPERVSNGLFALSWRYRLTARGRAALRGGKLCLADGIRVEQVEAFSAPEDVAGVTVSRARYRYALRAPQPWLTPAIRAGLERGRGASDSILLALKDRRWVVPDAAERERLQRGVAGEALAAGVSADSGAVAGPFAWFKRLFGPSGPNEADAWQALVRAVPVLAPEKARFALESCERVGEGPRFRCRVRLGGKSDQLVLQRDPDGAWSLVP